MCVKSDEKITRERRRLLVQRAVPHKLEKPSTFTFLMINGTI